MSGAVFKITGQVMNYDWGKLGHHSIVAQYAHRDRQQTIDNDRPYAEYWMGTHSTAPSHVVSHHAAAGAPPAAESLRSRLTRANLGDAVHAKYAGDLPFLFKVLSIRKALSIQAHPDRALAQKLHRERPNVYKDPNHKPEMAVAVTEFEGFMGFRPVAEIVAFLTSHAPFAAAVGVSAAAAFRRAVAEAHGDPSQIKPALRALFTALMVAPEDRVQACVRDLMALASTRLASSATHEPAAASSDASPEAAVDALVIRLNSQFPGDVGVFCSFLLNLVRLGPGEAVFLAANEPHAYLSGDIVECMAASDNVVRSGLTPKYKDVDTLTSMLTYNYGSAESNKTQGVPWKQTRFSVLYDPPIEEFSVVLTRMPAGAEDETHPGIDGPSVLVVAAGCGSLTWDEGAQQAPLHPGAVFYVGAGDAVTLKNTDKTDLVIYRALCVVE
ncbi:hypothetical protein CXG81DRAFT_14760 [Caulochytrium protostelioides]|uniref:Mannose-6-phosphate isomerase n=1 Tax=Caulochytrium protostelioides TaxID=1555241 RepID=A0A4P9X1X3_9FUNG|nr:mannose-6-phosphate isomerase [Caulochytrium protostelioides]RKO99262.1 hypothetical protein CXG81DRAFT_14760 [Caulochytrium protostelioides]|eukprot:RKO99262.1 hypothetical protein CXG81DRAFT_14760 [Caulochytrium protostelioides]